MPPPSNSRQEDPAAAARRRALRALARRELSSAQLRRKLGARGVPEPLAEQVAAECASRGWQSDRRFAELLVRQRVAAGYGPLRIRSELEAAGVGADLIGEALQAVEEDWSVLCARALHRRFTGAPDSPREWQRRYRYLAQRGFNGEQATRALKSAPVDPPEV